MRQATLMFLALALATPAAAQKPQGSPFPKAVQASLNDLVQTCRQLEGRPIPQPGLLQQADLTGDGIVDYVIHEIEMICEGAETAFAGNGGSLVTVFVGRGKDAVEAFSQLVQSADVITDGGRAKLFLGVSGTLCGQRNADQLSRAEETICRRPLTWNQAKGTFAFAPVSEIRPFQ